MTKLAQLQAYINNGDYLNALRIASKFPKIKGNADLIKAAYEMMVYPQFYKQLKKDVEHDIQLGIKELIANYSA